MPTHKFRNEFNTDKIGQLNLNQHSMNKNKNKGDQQFNNDEIHYHMSGSYRNDGAGQVSNSYDRRVYDSRIGATYRKPSPQSSNTFDSRNGRNNINIAENRRVNTNLNAKANGNGNGNGNRNRNDIEQQLRYRRDENRIGNHNYNYNHNDNNYSGIDGKGHDRNNNNCRNGNGNRVGNRNRNGYNNQQGLSARCDDNRIGIYNNYDGRFEFTLDQSGGDFHLDVGLNNGKYHLIFSENNKNEFERHYGIEIAQETNLEENRVSVRLKGKIPNDLQQAQNWLLKKEKDISKCMLCSKYILVSKSWSNDIYIYCDQCALKKMQRQRNNDNNNNHNDNNKGRQEPKGKVDTM